MKANFALAADLEIEVQDDQPIRDVVMRIVTGTNYEDVKPDPRQRLTVRMHKSAARAIASALMGCASQIE